MKGTARTGTKHDKAQCRRPQCWASGQNRKGQKSTHAQFLPPACTDYKKLLLTLWYSLAFWARSSKTGQSSIKQPPACSRSVFSGGEDGIRTHVTVLPVNRFSKPAPSATRPPLHTALASLNYQAVRTCSNC